MKAICLAVALLLAAPPAPFAWAQEAKVEGFRGIKSVFLIPNINDTAVRCGVEEQDVQTAVRFVLSQSSLAIKTDILTSDSLLHIVVHGSSASPCAVLVQLHVTTKVLRRSDHRLIDAAIAWEGGVAQFPLQQALPNGRGIVLGLVEQTTKRLVVQWAEANK